MEPEMPQNRLQELLKNKWLIGGVLGGLVLIVVIVLVMSSRKQPTAPAPQTQIPSTIPDSTQVGEPTPTKSPELQKAIAEQMKVDEEYADWESKVKEDYPWNKRLPLTSEKYYLYFSLEKKVFLGRIYTTPADNVEQLKAEVMKWMKDEDIPTDTYPFEWTVIPD